MSFFRTLNSDLYCQQLDSLKLVTDQKWPELANRRGVVFHQDIDTPHTSAVTRQTLGAWLGSFNASTIKPRPGIKRLLPFFRIAKLSEG
ncbi:hypothetical protein TNCV_2596161 [Trichonephila clavipes]|nr:hypothetical protein TNCV_2596161 [Trichonephila clavipes]